MKEKYEAKVGNETCVMHEMGMLDDDHEIDLQGMLAHMEQMNLNPWLKERLVQDKTLCYDYAQVRLKATAVFLKANILNAHIFTKIIGYGVSESKHFQCPFLRPSP